MRASNSWYRNEVTRVRYCYCEAEVRSSSVSVVYVVRLRTVFSKAALQKRSSIEPMEPTPSGSATELCCEIVRTKMFWLQWLSIVKYISFFYFRGLRKPRKYFYNENFQIYGVHITCSSIYNCGYFCHSCLCKLLRTRCSDNENIFLTVHHRFLGLPWLIVRMQIDIFRYLVEQTINAL